MLPDCLVGSWGIQDSRPGPRLFSGVAGFNDADELRSKSTIIGSGIKDPYNKERMNLINNRFILLLIQTS